MPSVNTSNWLPNRTAAADVTCRVFCFPHAGGGASAFRDWTRDQPPGAEVCAVQPPGREDRISEPFPDDLVTLAQTLATVLLPHLDLPYALVGNSVGAVVAFEVARHLQEWYGLAPIRLVVAAARPPGTRQTASAVSDLGDGELAAAVQDRYGGIPEEILRDPQHLAAFLPALRADLAMLEAYLTPPGPRLPCPVTALVGAGDQSMSLADLPGWNTVTDGDFDCVELPGDHFALLRHRDAVLGPVWAEAALLQPAALLPTSASAPAATGPGVPCAAADWPPGRLN
jgi:medium-chain acyl-[acyl-carrier-protein] hydrolase